ncbi:MAG: hypothetical protein FJ263_07265 [Planctomycetes bacterium]|nr:hypothetical protein [Planctomycetota bacterium]
MDSLYQSILSSSQTLLGQIGRAVLAEQADFGPFWVLLDDQRAVCAGDEQRLAEMIDDIASLHPFCSRVDDGFESVMCPAKDGVIAIGHLGTERTHCGYALLALPGYTADTAHANAAMIEMLLGQMNLLADVMEKNNLFHQEHLSRLSKQSPVLAER